jgi:hypothetical protein
MTGVAVWEPYLAWVDNILMGVECQLHSGIHLLKNNLESNLIDSDVFNKVLVKEIFTV